MNEPTIDPREGHTSASNAEADSLCPGRHQFQKGVPDDQRGKQNAAWAEYGTKIHSALSNPNQNNTLSVADHDTVIACRDIEFQLREQFFGSPYLNKTKVWRHHRMWLDFSNSVDGRKYRHSGEADFIARFEHDLLILDYKVLAGDIPASSSNMQLRDLAALAFGSFAMIEKIGVAIVQPLVTRNPEICVYSREDLLRAGGEMCERVVKSNAPDAPRVAGEVQCRFCRGRSACPEHAAWVAKLVPLAGDENAKLQQAAVLNFPMERWTPEQRAQAAEAINLVEKKLVEMYDWLRAGIEKDPTFIPGWHLAPGMVKTPIVNPQGVFDRFAAQGGSVEQFLKCVTVKKESLKEALKEATKLKGRPLTDEFTKLLAGMTEEKQNTPSLSKIKEGGK